jgi:hypothetical protein
VAFVGQSIPTTGQHGIIDVGQPHLAALAHASGEGKRQITGAAGDVEHARAFADPAALDRKGLPQPVHAARHQVVHQVVAAGD